MDKNKTEGLAEAFKDETVCVTLLMETSIYTAETVHWLRKLNKGKKSAKSHHFIPNKRYYLLAKLEE